MGLAGNTLSKPVAELGLWIWVGDWAGGNNFFLCGKILAGFGVKVPVCPQNPLSCSRLGVSKKKTRRPFQEDGLCLAGILPAEIGYLVASILEATSIFLPPSSLTVPTTEICFASVQISLWKALATAFWSM